MKLYHVTPHETWVKRIRKEGLVPRRGKRGFAARAPGEKRIYLFADRDTAMDALENWLLEEFPNERWFALLEVDVPARIKVQDDPEIAGSYYVTRVVPPRHVRLVESIDAGKPE